MPPLARDHSKEALCSGTLVAPMDELLLLLLLERNLGAQAKVEVQLPGDALERHVLHLQARSSAKACRCFYLLQGTLDFEQLIN